jgi:hypothetical protein
MRNSSGSLMIRFFVFMKSPYPTAGIDKTTAPVAPFFNNSVLQDPLPVFAGGMDFLFGSEFHDDIVDKILASVGSRAANHLLVIHHPAARRFRIVFEGPMLPIQTQAKNDRHNAARATEKSNRPEDGKVSLVFDLRGPTFSSTEPHARPKGLLCARRVHAVQIDLRSLPLIHPFLTGWPL